MKSSRFHFAPGAFRDDRRRTRKPLDDYRNARVRALVEHAYANVPYYRHLFDAHGIDPGDIRGVADLVHVPVTTKADLQACADTDIVARDERIDQLIVRRTTGSTGEPMAIRRSWMEERILGAFRWRALRSFGGRFSDRYVEIEETLEDEPNDRRVWHSAMAACGVLRQFRLNALASPQQLIERMSGIRPDVICGYAGVLAQIADTGEVGKAAGLRPRFLVAHSDTLTPRMRRAIEGAFGVPLYELYDCNEVNVIASLCKETGDLHTMDDTAIVEVLVNGRRAANGETGEIVLTSLHSWAMPFIRYRIGDLAIVSDALCGCGRPYATLKGVRGRMFDSFPLIDGRTIHPYTIIAQLERTDDWLRRYRIVQERRDRIVLELLPRSAPPPDAVESIRKRVEALTGAGVEIAVRIVTDIPTDGTAKLRVCRSLVSSEYDDTGS